MNEEIRKRIIEFYSMPKSDQCGVFDILECDDPLFNFSQEDFSDYEKMIIYLKKVSHYMDLIVEGRNLDKLVKGIIYGYYEDDCTTKEARESDDMYALAEACYYSEKDFSNKHSYVSTINPIIKTMEKII